MAFIKTDDTEGCFRPGLVTHFTVHVTIENFAADKRQYVSFMRFHSGNYRIAHYHWVGEQALSYELVGKILLQAENSPEMVLDFESLIEDEISLAQDLQ